MLKVGLDLDNEWVEPQPFFQAEEGFVSQCPLLSLLSAMVALCTSCKGLHAGQGHLGITAS